MEHEVAQEFGWLILGFFLAPYVLGAPIVVAWVGLVYLLAALGFPALRNRMERSL